MKNEVCKNLMYYVYCSKCFNVTKHYIKNGWVICEKCDKKVCENENNG